MKREQIGVQMYTLREQAAKDLEATLASIAKMGYVGVEFAGFYGHSASDVRGMLDRHGLRAFSAHIPATDFASRLNGVISDLQTIGAEWGVIPAIGPDDRNEAGMRALGEQMNGYGRALADAGLKFGYHNHAFEFEGTAASGKNLFDTLVEITEPGVVSFELDAFWAAVGGYEPDEVIRANADRIRLVHLKDASRDDPRKDVPFGTGVLDWGAILSAARRAGVEYYITEQDNPNPADPVGDVRTALQHAERLTQ